MSATSGRARWWLGGLLAVACAIGLLAFALPGASRDPAEPSLVLVSVASHPAPVTAGGTVTVAGRVRNRSDGARPGRLTVRIGPAHARTEKHMAVTTTLRPVGAGSSTRFAVAVGVPRSAPAGPYGVVACIDSGVRAPSCRMAEGALTVLAAAEGPRSPAVARTRGVFQTIQGFGTSERPFSDPHAFDVQGPPPAMSSRQRDAVLDALYGELGLTRIRTVQPDTAPGPPPAGMEVVNDNADPLSTDLSRFNFAGRRLDDHAEFVARARRNGARVAWISPLNRDAWMGVSPGTRDVAEYAEWLFAQIQRFSRRGARLDYVSVANEPSYTRNSMSGEFVRDVIKSLGPRLERAGLLVPFVISDDVRSSAAAATSATVLADPVARRYVGALATHLYDEPLDRLSAMRSLARRYRRPLWMTEFYLDAMGTIRPPDAAAATPIDWALLMHSLLADYGVSAVDYFWGFIGARGAERSAFVRLDFDGATYRGFTRTKMYYIFGQYSRFIRPGARRVAVASSDGGVKASAYRRARTRTIVVINAGPAQASTTLDATDLTGVRRLRQVRTSPTENWARGGDVRVSGTRTTVTLPPQSVTTLTGRKAG